ncbi:MAG: hypothetical protein QM704_12320 [Anaeromyxobacteraceae bacterium]
MPAHARTPRLAVLVVAALLAACSAAIDPLPPGAKVTCATDGDCPSGFFCSQVLDRCVEKGGADQTAPALVGPQVGPARVHAGDTVTVTFTASEDLSSEPFVHLQGSSVPLNRADGVGRDYTVQFSVTSDLGAGPKTVLATLVDLYGNEAADQLVGTFELDLTAPGAVATDFGTLHARKGTAFDVTVTFDEAVTASPTLAAGGKTFAVAPVGGSGTQWRFSRTLDGSEPESGDVKFALAATDLAGNVLESTLAGGVTFDFTVPTVVDSAVATPAVRPGTTFLGSVQFSEALGAAPVVSLVPAGGGATVAPTVGKINDGTYALSYDVPAGAANATYAVTLVSAADPAGNPAAGKTLGTFAVDSTPPAITGAAVTKANRLYKAGDTVAVTFTLGEAPASAPSVKLDVGVATLAFSCAAPAGLVYTCTSTGPVLGTYPEGGANVSISAADLAGNVGTASAPLVLDFTPPGLASAPAARYLGSASTRNVNVQAVGTGSSWEIALLTDEPLSGTPVVTAAAPGGNPSRALSLTSSNAAKTSFTFTLGPDATAYPAATWNVTWTGTDAAGNSHATPQALATVNVDGTPPPAPDPGAAATPGVLWTRWPWGTDADPTPVLQLDASLASTGTDAIAMIAWDGPTAGAKEVGRHAPSAAQGPFTLQLGSDPAELYVSTLDKAGNESPRTRVVDVAWTAALAGKVPGSTFENPHRLEARTRTLGALAQLDAVQASGAAVGVAGDAASLVTTASALWRPTAGAIDPGARVLYAMGADPARGVVVVANGLLANTTFPGDLWEWNGAIWREVLPTDPEGDGNLSKNYFGPLVFDPIRGGLLAYTGALWLWNGTSWRNLGAGPAVAGIHAWDAKRAVLVLYGTNGGTYEWNGTAWKTVSPPQSPSPVRQFSALYFDTDVNQTCLYGGRTQAGTYLGDLWCYDGATWNPVATAGAATPFPRSDYAWTWDPGRKELFLQSGRPELSATVDGKTWVLRRIAGVPTWFDVTPGALDLRQHAAAYDASSKRVVMFGDTAVPSTLRAWDGAAYASLAPGDPEADGNPSVLSRTSTPVYVPGRGRVVFPQQGNTLETWEWDRVSWAHRASGGANAAGSGSAIGALGSDVLLFGGNALNVALGDTYRWNGAAWSLLEAASHPVGAFGAAGKFRTEAGTATDTVGNKLYRVGGYDSYFDTSAHQQCTLDVWEWTGATWALSTGGGPTWNDPEGDGTPSATVNAVVPPCKCRDHVVWSTALSTLLLLDDSANFSSGPYVVWEWRRATTSWAKHTLTGPQPSSLMAFFWDTTLGAPVLHDNGGAFAVDLAGNRLVPLTSANPLGGATPATPVVAFDAGTGQAVFVEASPWTWESPAKGSPAQLFTADFSRAGGPDPAVCVSNAAACPIQQIDLSWTTGATSPAGPNGVALQGWTGGWQDLGTNGATAAAPARTTWTWTPASPLPAALLFHGAARELSFQVLPRGTSSGVTAAQIATDAVAVTVRYRRP